METLYYSPMLLGVALLLAVAISSTALWHVSRPYAGPVLWMAGSWTLIAGILVFFGYIATGSPVLNVLGNAGQLAGEALFLIGIFHFMGRTLPWWIVPASVGVMVAFNIHYWVVAGSSDFLAGVYSTIAGLLPLQAIWLLFKSREDPATRPAQLLVGCSLLLYSGVVLLRGFYGYHDWWYDKPYVHPVESFSYLLPYNFGIPALLMGFFGVTLMTMQRILAMSRVHQMRAEYLATRDDLTLLLNRRAFRTVAARDLARAQRAQHSLCMAMIDLDHFKRINDNYGHSFGDEALRHFAECWQSQLRETDVLARYGGEEFVLLLPDTAANEAQVLLERARLALADTALEVNAQLVKVTVSAGVTLAMPGDTIDSLLSRADEALYQAKDAGRNRVQVWAPSA